MTLECEGKFGFNGILRKESEDRSAKKTKYTIFKKSKQKVGLLIMNKFEFKAQWADMIIDSKKKQGKTLKG